METWQEYARRSAEYLVDYHDDIVKALDDGLTGDFGKLSDEQVKHHIQCKFSGVYVMVEATIAKLSNRTLGEMWEANKKKANSKNPVD